jgi:hypothetical protein
MRRATPTRSAADRTLNASVATSHTTDGRDIETNEIKHAGEAMEGREGKTNSEDDERDDEPLTVATKEAEAVQHFLFDQRGLFLEWAFSDKELGQMLVDRQLARANACDHSSGFPRSKSMDTTALLDAAVEAALDFQDMFELANARLKRMTIEKAELEVEVGELKYWVEMALEAKTEQERRLRRSIRREDKLREQVASLQYALDSVQGRCMEYELRDAIDAAHSRSRELCRCRVTRMEWKIEALKPASNALPSVTKCSDALKELSAVSIKAIDDAKRGDRADHSTRGNGSHG